MKHLTLFILLALCAPVISKAQEGFRFGLRVTPLISFAKLDSAKKEPKLTEGSSKMGFSGGLVFTYGFMENVAIESGVNVAMMGYSIKTKNTTPIVTNKYSLTYVNIPVMLKLRTNELGGSGIYAKGYFGGTLGLKVGASANASESQTPFLDKGKNSIGNHMQPFGVWFNFGGGVDWDIDGVGTIDLGLVYGLGLTNSLRKGYSYVAGKDGNGNDIKVEPYKDLRAKLSYIGLNIGFWFPTGK